jgi:ribose-phosphate pyrophosphokinase
MIGRIASRVPFKLRYTDSRLFSIASFSASSRQAENVRKSNMLAYAFAGSLALGSGVLFTQRKDVVSAETTVDDDPLIRSVKGEKVHKERKAIDRETRREDILVLSGNSNIPLAQAIVEHMGTNLGKIALGRFADGEVSLRILESVRGKDVYIIQPTSPPVNEHLMELLLMISTCRRASAKRITAVVPYYGYARQDRKMNSRVPISAADVARLIETMGVDRVVAVDLHCGQIQGFFGPRVPVDNLGAQLAGETYFAEMGLKNVVVISPDAGGVYRARKFQEGLLVKGVGDVSIAMLIKQRSGANKIDRMDLVGSVKDADCIIVDDMIDTAGTLCEAARELKKHGAKRVFAFATHGLFNGPAVKRIEESPLEQVIVTDTIKLSESAKSCKKIQQLSISVLIADCIRRIHQKESLNVLFGEQ